MKVLGLAYHTGSGNAVAASAKALIKAGDDVTLVAQDAKQAGIGYANFGLGYTALSDYGYGGEDEFKRLERIYRNTNPNVILVSTSAQTRPNEFVIEQQAVKLGVPVVAVLDAQMEYEKRFSDLGTNNRAYLPSVIALPDDFSYQEMVALGFDPQLLKITGNPYFDFVASQRFTDKQIRETREAMGASLEDKLVLYASDYLTLAYGESFDVAGAARCRRSFGYTEHDALLEVIDFVKKHPDKAKVCLKPHPKEVSGGHVRILQEMVGDAPIRFIAHTDEERKRPELDMNRVLAASDVYVFSISSTQWNALLVNPSMPLISLQPGALFRFQNDTGIATRMGLTIPVYEREEFADTLLSSLDTDPTERETKVREQLNIDGKAGERIVELVHSIGGRG